MFNGTGDAPKLTGTVMVDPATGVGTIGTTTTTNVPARGRLHGQGRGAVDHRRVYAMTDQDGDSVVDAETSLVGFHLQAGYMADKHWQPSARFAWGNDPRQKAKTARDQQEITVGANYYGHGHDASFADMILLELGSNVGW